MTSFYAHRLHQIETELEACHGFLAILVNLQAIGLKLIPSQEDEKRKLELEIENLLKSKEMWTIIASNYPIKHEKEKFTAKAKYEKEKRQKLKKFYKDRLKQIEIELEACNEFKRVLQKMRSKGLLTEVQKLEYAALEADIQGLLSNQQHWRRIANILWR